MQRFYKENLCVLVSIEPQKNSTKNTRKHILQGQFFKLCKFHLDFRTHHMWRNNTNAGGSTSENLLSKILKIIFVRNSPSAFWKNFRFDIINVFSQNIRIDILQRMATSADDSFVCQVSFWFRLILINHIQLIIQSNKE